MSLSRSNPRAKPRWALSAAIVGILLVASAGLSYAAVFGSPTDSPYVFELDRNPQDAGGNTADDWATLYDSDANDLLPVSGAIDAILTHDEPNVDETYFTGGSSKDDIDIDTVAGTPGSGGWLRDKTSSAQPKADIQHAFAATYLVDADNNAATDGETTVYFGLDRFSNDGATFAGFWFLQSDVTLNPTTANNGVGEINGQHQRGDLLIITDFTQGGPVVNFAVYVWIGQGGEKYPLPVDQTVINGVFQKLYAGTDCTTSPATAVACSTVNNTVVDAVWPFSPKPNVGPVNKYQPGLFLEGGIDITDAFAGQDTPCFSSYVAETRASFSLDSTLSDFTLGGFNTCGSVTALKYHDKNANGSRDADGADDEAGTADDEVGLPGWTIFIDENDNETLDSGETSVVTDSNGEADFGSALPAGGYSFCEVLDNAVGQTHVGWLNSDPAGTTLCEDVTVGSGESSTVDFGNYQLATKSGVKFHDRNGDGIRQANGADGDAATTGDNEVLLSGWEIHLFGTAGDGSTVDLHTNTDGSGAYSFSVKPGSYTVCETLKTGWKQTLPSTATAACGSHTTGAGGATITPAAAGYSINLLSADVDSNNDFGNQELYKLIILTCSEASGQLVASTVTLSGFPEKVTITPNQQPAGITGDLCTIPGAAYPGLTPGNRTPTVTIPRYQ
jgi:hypothetical protein